MSENKNQNTSTVQEVTLANKRTALALTIICSIIAAAYVLEVVKKTRTLGYSLIVVALAMIPVIWTQIEIRRNPASSMIKHIVGIGYAIMYTFVLMTTNNALVFTYAIPMLIIVTLYEDVTYTTIIGVGVCIVNILSIIVQIVQGKLTDTAMAEIQGLVIILIIAYLIMVSRTNHSFQLMRAEQLQKEHQTTTDLLDNVLTISSRMTDTVAQVADEMDALKDSVEQTRNSMDEVSRGTGESADAAQKQLEQTTEISNHIHNVEGSMNTITENVDYATDAVSAGQKNISRMESLTGQVDTAGKDVADALSKFQQTAAEMNSITDMITNVASQTSLLALNASIEAARAGEAGRGFAVVANEISNLASQTTGATDNITSLINDVVSQVDMMVSTIEKLLQAGEEESECAADTAASFEKIYKSVDVIKQHTSDLDGIVLKLSEANDEIVGSIETASAVTEEVTAHATATFAISEDNQKIVENINSLISRMSEDAEKLKAYTA